MPRRRTPPSVVERTPAGYVVYLGAQESQLVLGLLDELRRWQEGKHRIVRRRRHRKWRWVLGHVRARKRLHLHWHRAHDV